MSTHNRVRIRPVQAERARLGSGLPSTHPAKEIQMDRKR